MKILYKYVENPNFILKDGYIRASQLCALNDPFEGNYCEEGLSKLAEEIKFGYGVDTNLCEFVENNKHKIGVVCLTESKENLLMWSHYAKEHKGCVIGFIVSSKHETEPFHLFDNLFEHDNFEIVPSPFNGAFEAVSYRKQPRYRIDSFDCDYSNFHEEQILYEIFQRKSDEWIYEKEHRAILRLSQADKVILTEDALLTHRDPSHFLEMANDLKCYEKVKNEHHFLLEKISDRCERGAMADALENFSKCRDVLYLFKLNKSSIRSITYGYNSSLIDSACEFKEIFSTRFFEHWETCLNKTNYTLNFKEIDFI